MKAHLVDVNGQVVRTIDLDRVAGRAWGGRNDPNPDVITYRGVAYVRDSGTPDLFCAAPTLALPPGTAAICTPTPTDGREA